MLTSPQRSSVRPSVAACRPVLRKHVQGWGWDGSDREAAGSQPHPRPTGAPQESTAGPQGLPHRGWGAWASMGSEASLGSGGVCASYTLSTWRPLPAHRAVSGES